MNMPAVRSTYIPHLSDLFVRRSPIVTLKAWRPFSDCVGVNFDLQNSDIGPDFPEWRMKWVYGVVTLRTIGHVLDKVDGAASLKHRAVIDGVWADWKANRRDSWVFWEFIEQERNSILKTYDFGVEADEDGGLWHAGIERDGVQLMREATYWWRAQLEEIEHRLNA